MGSDVWTWRYRRGAFDTREQKRLVVSPLGDGGDEGEPYAQSWEYSLTGVVGEELVLYKGIQTTKTAVVWPLNNGQTDQGRRVYMAMSRFFVAGTELQYLPNGYKELHITDNQGNVRTIFEVYNNSTIRSFDYKPFGEKEWTSTDNDHDRKGFAGSEYDSESDYYAMGYRMYSAEFGRFLAVDPLFEAMPRHNPYHYSFNSPMFWSDPSGLVPVKEKVKGSEQLLAIEWNQTIFEEARDGIIAENGKRSAFVKSSNMGDYWCAKAMQSNDIPFWMNWKALLFWDLGITGSTSSASARSGEEAAGENGGAWNISNQWNDAYIKKYKDFAQKQAEMYKEMGKEFTCEDLALQILIDFASQNELPLEITNGEGTFNAGSNQFDSPLSYSNKVLSTTGANDLISFGNTVGITLDQISSGDILVERRNGKTGNHVQLVEYSNSTSIYIFQGNSGNLNWIPGSSRLLGAGNPSSIFYTGQQIQSGHIYKSTGTYVNFTTKQFYSEYTKSFNVVGAKWNFQNWKK